MEIQPASLFQIRRGRDGRKVWVDADVGNIAAQLRELDPRLRLQYNEKSEVFWVVEVSEDGQEERGVFSAQECDGRIVDRARRIASESYNLVAEMDRIDKEAEKRIDDEFHERAGEAGEHAAHALRKDLEDQHRIVVPKDVRSQEVD